MNAVFRGAFVQSSSYEQFKRQTRSLLPWSCGAPLGACGKRMSHHNHHEDPIAQETCLVWGNYRTHASHRISAGAPWLLRNHIFRALIRFTFGDQSADVRLGDDPYLDFERADIMVPRTNAEKLCMLTIVEPTCFTRLKGGRNHVVQ
jgi:hypothetical protein